MSACLPEGCGVQGLTARILLPPQLAVWSWENGLASVQLSYSSVKNGDRNTINLRAGVTINREYACRALSTCLAHDKCSINRRCHYHHRDIKLRETSSLLTASTDAPPTATHLSPPPHVPRALPLSLSSLGPAGVQRHCPPRCQVCRPRSSEPGAQVPPAAG